MATQLPNGYEAVKVPEGISRVSISDDYEGPNALSYMIDEHWHYDPLPSTGYIFLGRADELTEVQCIGIVEGRMSRFNSAYGKNICSRWLFIDYVNKTAYCYTALESFRSLLASLHLEPHTTIILKKENV